MKNYCIVGKGKWYWYHLLVWFFPILANRSYGSAVGQSKENRDNADAFWISMGAKWQGTLQRKPAIAIYYFSGKKKNSNIWLHLFKLHKFTN